MIDYLFLQLRNNGKVKIFYIPSIGYFMAVQTDNRFELYKLITGLTKSTEVIYWDWDLNTNYTESRLYNESLYILKNNEFQYINLANSNQNNEKFSNQFQTVGLSELNNTSFSKIQNFIMLNEWKAAILLEEKIAIYDLVKEKVLHILIAVYKKIKSNNYLIL